MPDSRRQRLDLYRLPQDFNPGAPWLLQSLWFCFGAPLLSMRNLPGSAWRVSLLRRFGAQIADGCRLKPGLRVKYPWRLCVGFGCWLGEDVWIDNLAEVWIGDQVCLSQGVYLCTGNHDFRDPAFTLRCSPILIESGAWIGAQARLSPGVCVGADAVVTLGSVVHKPVPAAVVVAGHPASPIGARWRD